MNSMKLTATQIVSLLVCFMSTKFGQLCGERDCSSVAYCFTNLKVDDCSPRPSKPSYSGESSNFSVVTYKLNESRGVTM